MTDIKKLQQNGKEFVPITLAEAVVVNVENLQGYDTLGKTTSGKTTLDKVLNALAAIDYSQQSAIIDINNTLKSLKAGFSYQIVNELPTPPNVDCLGTIYLVKGSDINQNKYAEYICIFNNAEYSWEMLGIINSEVDLTGYVTKDDFDAFTAVALTAEDVTDSSGNRVSVNYTIPENLYDT